MSYLRASAVVLLGAWASESPAQDWRVTGTATQNFSFVDRLGENENLSLQSSTTLGFSASLTTPTTTLNIQPGLSFFTEIGDNTSIDQNSFRPSLRASIANVGPRLAVDGNVSVTPRFLSRREFDIVDEFDPGTDPDFFDERPRARDVDPIEITVNAGLGASYRIDPRNAVNTRIFARYRDYSETTDTLQPNQSYGGSLGWSRSLNERTSVRLGGTARTFLSSRDNVEQRTTYSLSTGLTSALTQRHVLSVNAGATTTGEGLDDIRFTGGASVSYRGTDTTFSIGANQGVSQDEDGDLNLVTSTNFNVNYSINSVSSLSLGMRVSGSTPIADDTPTDTTFTFAPSYRYRITDLWSIRLGYGLQLSTDSTDDTTQRVFFSIARQIDGL